MEIGQGRAGGVRIQLALRHVHVQISETIPAFIIERHDVGLAGSHYRRRNADQLS